jgi:DNA polymerase I
LGGGFFLGATVPNFDLSIPNPTFIETEQEAETWIKHFLESHKIVGSLGLDSETSGLIKHKDVVIIWSLSDGANRVCIPSKFIHLFKKPILENPDINFDLTNAKFDAHMFANSGADISKAGNWYCTLPQSFLLDENRQGRHGLKDCKKDYLGREPITFEMVFGKIPPARKGVKKTSGDLIHAALEDPVQKMKASDYASIDAYDTFMLRRFFDNALAGIEMFPGFTLKDFYHQVECKFTKVLWKLERRGFQVDAGYLYELKGPMEARMLSIEKEFNKLAGQAVNLRAHGQVRNFFIDILGKQPLKMTSGGAKGIPQPSVDEEVLDTWAGQGDPFAIQMLEYRGIEKAYSTYVTSLMDIVDSNYRVHTTLNQIGAASGRLSSADPNLQNVPRPDEDEFKIRKAFIASEGKRLIVADYEQLEMRLMAHFSQDQKMVDAIRQGTDLHCLTVSEMYGIPYDEVVAAKKAKKEQITERQKDLVLKRQQCKAVGFGIIYGIGGRGLGTQLTKSSGEVVTPEEGNTLIKKWLDVFPNVRYYIEYLKGQMRRVGHVQTIVGRFRRCGDLNNMSRNDASQMERTLVNAVIQGSAADIAKASMLKAESDEVLKQYGAEMLLQVHDELVFEVIDNDDTVKACKDRIKEIMEHPFNQELLVPLPISVGDGYAWSTAK